MKSLVKAGLIIAAFYVIAHVAEAYTVVSSDQFLIYLLVGAVAALMAE